MPEPLAAFLKWLCAFAEGLSREETNLARYAVNGRILWIEAPKESAALMDGEAIAGYRLRLRVVLDAPSLRRA